MCGAGEHCRRADRTAGEGVVRANAGGRGVGHVARVPRGRCVGDNGGVRAIEFRGDVADAGCDAMDQILVALRRRLMFLGDKQREWIGFGARYSS